MHGPARNECQLTYHSLDSQVALRKHVKLQSRVYKKLRSGNMDSLCSWDAGCLPAIVSCPQSEKQSPRIPVALVCPYTNSIPPYSVARIRRLGIRNLQTDDYLMVFAIIWYTILCVSLNEVVIVGGSNLMSEEDIRNLTPAIKADRVRGSKWVFVSEHSFVLAVWAMKTCMLIIYARIT